MARTVVNKHFDNKSLIDSGKFTDIKDYKYGELIISNQPGNEAIAIINTDGKTVFIEASNITSAGTISDEHIKAIAQEEIEKLSDVYDVKGAAEAAQSAAEATSKKYVDEILETYATTGYVSDAITSIEIVDYTNDIKDIKTSIERIESSIQKDHYFMSTTDYETLISKGSVEIDGVTITYDDNAYYLLYESE